MQKKILVVLGIIIGILFFTNPSRQSYKGFIEYDFGKRVQTTQKGYFLIFSMYEAKFRKPVIIDGFGTTKITHIGIFGIFFETSKYGYEIKPYYSPLTKKYYKTEEELPIAPQKDSIESNVEVLLPPPPKKFQPPEDGDLLPVPPPKLNLESIDSVDELGVTIKKNKDN